MNQTFFCKWRTNFLTGLAVAAPAILTIALAVWIFRNIASLTEFLLIVFPRSWTHQNGGQGELYWYSNLLAVFMAVVLISLLGALARFYFGRRLISHVDQLLMQIPLFNKVYAALKQINEAFASSSKSSFKQVVVVEFPRQGIYSLGFITNENLKLATPGLPDELTVVFVPTTPNPTSGFMLMVPASAVTPINIPVSDALKLIISLGSIAPEKQQEQIAKLKTITCPPPSPNNA